MTAVARSGFSAAELRLFRGLFVIAALWNFAGAVPGLFLSDMMFQQEFGRRLADPVLLAIYRGAWGTAFLYGFGFLMVAANPRRNVGVVIMGGTGKALFAGNLLYMYLSGWVSPSAVAIIACDVVFTLLFALYLARLKRSGGGVL
jgi:hypothetical protein